ncbi:MAG: TIM barrel protein [Paracoccaceae bacterium]|nr:TIM barrel protein [Paracoccaceae bacterium]
MQFSANLGFLFTELSLPQAIFAAHDCGFDAVECHFPYDVPAAEVAEALAATGLPMLGLNTQRGNVVAGDFGLSALPGRQAEARAAIDEAIAYAAAIGALNVHVMAGKTDGGAAAEATFRDNLRYATDAAARQGLSVLIEPINTRDVPGYHLNRVEHAAEIIAALGQSNLRLMFDCYHVQITQGDLFHRLTEYLPLIGHVQIAAVPDRGEPDAGELCYPQILAHLAALGYARPIGAEYRPRGGDTRAGLSWLEELRNTLP